MRLPPSVQQLVDHFARLPGIGPKTAQRLVFYMMGRPFSELESFSRSLADLKKSFTTCSVCHNVTQNNPCFICSDSRRNTGVVCVVAKPQDLIAIEKTHEYLGKYHVLGGTLNPIENIHSYNLHIQSLLHRIRTGKFTEVILGLNPDIEGETTSLHLVELIKPLHIKISKLGRGLPMGADLEYADDVTLLNALKGRKEV